MFRISAFFPVIVASIWGITASGQEVAKPADPVLLMPVFSLEAFEVNSVPIKNGPVAKISVAPGDVITAKIMLRNWSPQGQKLRGYQAKIDPAGYTSGSSGWIKPVGHNPGTQNDANAFIDTKDPTFVQRGLGSIPLVDAGAEGYRWLNVLLEPEKGPIAQQDGKKYTCGTLRLQASPDATGTFSIGFMEENLASGLLDEANAPIIPLGFEPLQIEVKSGVKWLRIESSDPPNGAVDARIHKKDETAWKSVVLEFKNDVGEVSPSDFEVMDGSGSPPTISAVEASESQVLITLDRAVRDGTWTTITHKASSSMTRIGRLAGDVDNNGRSDADDLMVLIEGLNGNSKLTSYAADLDGNGTFQTKDALMLIELLNKKRPRQDARIR